jgi:hypothetical protein
MDLTILGIQDETPRGLTTGFRLKFRCQAAPAPPFWLTLPIRVTREMLDKSIPLANLVLAYLRSEGLDDYPDFYVDTRRFDAGALATEPPRFPITLTLGGNESLAQKAVAGLTARAAAAP